MTNFITKLEHAIEKNDSLLCIGLDSDVNKIPEFLKGEEDGVYHFNRAIIDKTAHLVSSYKLNIAFYSAYGMNGLKWLLQTIAYIKDEHPTIPVILDAKRGDIDATADYYAKEVFDAIDADAVTINPLLGFDAVRPFLQRKEKGVIILCRTSNLSAADFQSLPVDNEPLYLHIARKVQKWHEEYKNCLLVVGATWPEEMKKIREICPSIFFLVPGIGAQGGDLQKTMEAGLMQQKTGLIIHSARGIIYAGKDKQFAEKSVEEAEKLKNAINKHRSP